MLGLDRSSRTTSTLSRTPIWKRGGNPSSFSTSSRFLRRKMALYLLKMPVMNDNNTIDFYDPFKHGLVLSHEPVWHLRVHEHFVKEWWRTHGGGHKDQGARWDQIGDFSRHQRIHSQRASAFHCSSWRVSRIVANIVFLHCTNSVPVRCII